MRGMRGDGRPVWAAAFATLIVAVSMVVSTSCAGDEPSPASSVTSATSATSTSVSTGPSSISTEPSSTTIPVSSTTIPGSSTTTPASSTTTSALPVIIPGVTTVRYEDRDQGFSMDRPETSLVLVSGFEGYLPLTQTALVAFTLPEDLFKGTNLFEAGVYLGVSSSPAVVSAWDRPVEGSAEVSAGTAEIGRTRFAVFTSTEPAAGNIYEEKVYRAIHEGACFEIVELLHSGNIGNFTAGTVVEFDRDRFVGYLEAMVRSLAFLPR